MKVEIIREGKYSDYLGSFGNYLNISKRIVCFSDTHMGDGTILIEGLLVGFWLMLLKKMI